MSVSHFLTGSALFSLIGGLLTLVAAIIAARTDNMPLFYVIMLFVASVVTLGGSWWGAAEQQYFQKYVTGGDSYAYLEFEDQKEGYYHWKIKHRGEYPVYDVTFAIMDVIKKRDVDLRDPLQRIEALRDIQPIPVITKEMNRLIKGIHKVKDSRSFFEISIDARNRSLSQVVELQKVGEDWKSAYLIFDKTNYSNPIYEHVDDGYPVNEEGKVDWHFEVDGKPFKEVK